MQRTFKRTLAFVLTVIMLFSSVPIGALTGLDIVSLFATEASAINCNYEIRDKEVLSVYADSEVYIKFVPEKSGTYSFTSFGDNDTICNLYDENLEYICTDDDSGSDHNFLLTYDLQENKTYYFGVMNYYGGSGNIEVYLNSEAPECITHSFSEWKTIKAATYTDTGTQTRTCTICGATETKVIAKLATKAISKCTVVLSKTSVTYTSKEIKPSVTVKNGNTTLKAGTHYTVTYKNNIKCGIATVTTKGVEKNGYSGSTNRTFKILPAKITGLKASVTAGSVKLTWTKVAGASGYRVFKYDTKNKKYIRVADTTNLSYTVSKLTPTTSYKLAVRAYAKSGNSVVWSASYPELTVKTTKMLTPKVKATASKNTIKLTWGKIDGAKGYVVYKYNSSDKKYTKVTTVSTTSATIKNLKYSTKYSYAVRAYASVNGKTVYSKYSSIVKIKTPARLPEIKLNKSSASIYVGATTTLKATSYPTNVTVKWKTSDKSIATVSSSGKVTAVKKGTATITGYFKYKDKTYKATCKVTVKKPSISLNKTSAKIESGKSVKLNATTIPGNVSVKWETSNKSIAKVSSSGKVTGVNKGTATIMASFKYKGKTYKATCKVTVKVVTLSTSSTTVNLKLGQTKTINIAFNVPYSSYVYEYLDASSLDDTIADCEFNGGETTTSSGRQTFKLDITGYTTGTTYIYVENSVNSEKLKIKVNVSAPDISVELPKTPQRLNSYNYNNRIISSVLVTAVRYEVSYSDYSGYNLKFYFDGKKIYDVNGSGQSRNESISWKLYKGDVVLESGTTSTEGVAVGERFVNASSWGSDIPSTGRYKLVLLHTN